MKEYERLEAKSRHKIAFGILFLVIGFSLSIYTLNYEIEDEFLMCFGFYFKGFSIIWSIIMTLIITELSGKFSLLKISLLFLICLSGNLAIILINEYIMPLQLPPSYILQFIKALLSVISIPLVPLMPFLASRLIYSRKELQGPGIILKVFKKYIVQDESI